MKKPDWPKLEAELEPRLTSRPRPVLLTRAQLAESASRYVSDELNQVLAEQNEAGVWPRLVTEKAGPQGSYNIGAYFELWERRVNYLLSLLERSTILTGESQREIWEFPSVWPIQERDHSLRHQNWMDLSQR